MKKAYKNHSIFQDFIDYYDEYGNEFRINKSESNGYLIYELKDNSYIHVANIRKQGRESIQSIHDRFLESTY